MYVTRFWKTSQKVTLLGLFHFVAPNNSYTYHHWCSVALRCLANWSAFLEQVFLTMYRHYWDNEAHGRHWIGGMGKYWPQWHLLGPPGLSRPISVLLGLMATLNNPNRRYNPHSAAYPPHSLHPPIPYTCHYSDIEITVKVFAQNPAVVASYCI